MGNCVSQDPTKFFLARRQHHELFSTENPYVFRVFVKKRNKFIPGLLKVADCEILFSRGVDDCQSWPLQFLRRYGYTYAGIFFFESGRRCPTGEGYHTFQSHQAERIFQLVQSRIQRNARYLCSARSSCATSVSGSRIHPLQKFRSEGANVGSDYLNPTSSSLCYQSYHRSNSRNLRRTVVPPPPPSRPRSVASAIEHSSVLLPSSCHQLQRNKSSASDALSYQGSDAPCFSDIASEQLLHPDDDQVTHSYVNVPCGISDRTRTLSRMGSYSPYYGNGCSQRYYPDRFASPSSSTPTNEMLDYVSVCRTDRSVLRSSDSTSSRASSTISYAKIDLEKTKALEQAVHIDKLENGRYRHCY
uniref:IRS-type PTB domain-containing protein n=1 Tax=Steinernema glaseri TaxID=37863 RepID=A0A1I7Y1H5_9BILA